MKKKLYYDLTDVKNCIGFFSSKMEIVPAGTAVSTMPLHYRNAEYQRFSEELDIHFFFGNDKPDIDFFTVPYLEIVARDSMGGYFALSEEELPVWYLDRGKQCYFIAANLSAFRNLGADWRRNMVKSDEVMVFSSKEAAQEVLEFLEVDEKI